MRKQKDKGLVSAKEVAKAINIDNLASWVLLEDGH